MFDGLRDALSRWQDSTAATCCWSRTTADGMRPGTFDLVQRLTAVDLDAEDCFSILLVGTERLLEALRAPMLEMLRTSLVRPCAAAFTLEEPQSCVRFHLQGAGARQPGHRHGDQGAVPGIAGRVGSGKLGWPCMR